MRKRPDAFLRRVIAQREKEQEEDIVARVPLRRCSSCRDPIPENLPGEHCRACARRERRRVAAAKNRASADACTSRPNED